MNTSMELHDSRILSLTRMEDGSGDILFGAVSYCSEGKPGNDAQLSGWQNVRMRFTGMTVHGALSGIGITQTDIYDGKLVAASQDFGGFFSTCASYDSPIVLSMFISNDGDYRDLEICAESLQIVLEGPFIPEHARDKDGNIRNR